MVSGAAKGGRATNPEGGVARPSLRVFGAAGVWRLMGRLAAGGSARGKARPGQAQRPGALAQNLSHACSSACRLTVAMERDGALTRNWLCLAACRFHRRAPHSGPKFATASRRLRELAASLVCRCRSNALVAPADGPPPGSRMHVTFAPPLLTSLTTSTIPKASCANSKVRKS